MNGNNNHVTCDGITIAISVYPSQHGTRREHLEAVLEKINSLLKAHPPAGIRAVQINLPGSADVFESEELRASEWRGADVCLKTSLLEYGLCFRESDSKLDVVHPCSHGNGYTMSSFDLPLDFRKEFNWVNWEDVCRGAGLSPEEWEALPAERKIENLVSRHGVENIFGTDYAKDGHYTFLNPDNTVLFSTRSSQPE